MRIEEWEDRSCLSTKISILISADGSTAGGGPSLSDVTLSGLLRAFN
jgi:hypothetical protein